LNTSRECIRRTCINSQPLANGEHIQITNFIYIERGPNNSLKISLFGSSQNYLRKVCQNFQTQPLHFLLLLSLSSFYLFIYFLRIKQSSSIGHPNQSNQHPIVETHASINNSKFFLSSSLLSLFNSTHNFSAMCFHQKPTIIPKPPSPPFQSCNQNNHQHKNLFLLRLSNK
jgi:hypothetical protein